MNNVPEGLFIIQAGLQLFMIQLIIDKSFMKAINLRSLVLLCILQVYLQKL